MLIEVFQDTVCPWCRIGERNLMKALEEWKGEPVEVQWRAFLLDPGVPEGGLPFKETLAAKFGSADRAEQAFGQVTQAGRAVGLDFHFDRVEFMPDTRLSHQVIALAPEERRTALVEAIHQAYFENGKDIGSLDVLLEVVSGVGLDAAAIRQAVERGEGVASVGADLEYAGQVGISGVPFFIIGGKYALTGAQPPETFLKVMQRVSEEEAE
ncbi:DsbA family oxidoreductase [Paenibacillus cremeus]|uniref:DsbA family oxidoreductase n=1 Tax=Paenibacillus cremeus TaxID=2163881 RepID=A0A559KF83_9BACL|nr:DsbA family oxidoreductase [Paenibacillus cremeus]TVY10786.1 DsbA family oxidoreductase [Paenibacillus cremeus]